MFVDLLQHCTVLYNYAIDAVRYNELALQQQQQQRLLAIVSAVHFNQPRSGVVYIILVVSICLSVSLYVSVCQTITFESLDVGS